MSAGKRWRLICYDIRDDARYRKVFKLLRGTAMSVQYSIFRARLDDRETERLRWQLSKLMAPEDALLIIDLCPRCAENVVSRNHVDGWTAEPPPFAIIGADSLRGPTKERHE
ncbi:MAG: CRISPR-associated endonuclease Cas2, partial [Phycisphaerales bacterium]|nr:CRISPR-associated endonuclease Cas2 [Phycisphaerales bacterium]